MKVLHADGTGGLHTVGREQNPRNYDLIKTSGDHTGVPVLLQTSFNEEQTIRCTPREAVNTFLRTKMTSSSWRSLVCER